MKKLSNALNRIPRIRARSLARAQFRTQQKYETEIAEARKRGDTEAVRSLNETAEEEYRLAQEERDLEFSRSIVGEANSLRVALPDFPPWHSGEGENEFWERGHRMGQLMLTARGISTLRTEIRKEREARRNERAHWAVWIGALTGLIGAITGLAAVLSATK